MRQVGRSSVSFELAVNCDKRVSILWQPTIVLCTNNPNTSQGLLDASQRQASMKKPLPWKSGSASVKCHWTIESAHAVIIRITVSVVIPYTTTTVHLSIRWDFVCAENMFLFFFFESHRKTIWSSHLNGHNNIIVLQKRRDFSSSSFYCSFYRKFSLVFQW